MIYITTKLSPAQRQMTLEDLLFKDFTPQYINHNTTFTRTYTIDCPNARLLQSLNTPHLVQVLRSFNAQTEPLRCVDRASLYTTYFIPKRSGGLRRIDAPKPELMDALRRLKEIFETDFFALYHTSAFAYVKGRSAIDAIKRHQANQSKWFAKLDLRDFFGSTTLPFAMNMLSMIFPFSEVMLYDDGREELCKALELGFLNGGLPQGTPLSPMLTNILMIPIDHICANAFRSFNNQMLVYTRYSDDFQISSRFSFGRFAGGKADYRDFAGVQSTVCHQPCQNPLWVLFGFQLESWRHAEQRQSNHDRP